MGDGESSGGGKRGVETVVIDHGKRRSSCGYCKSSSYTSISHGLWAHSMTVDNYQELLDRGWRRSGCYLYKPQMERTCCPSYTIRLKASDFVPSKEQLRVCKKMERYLHGKVNGNKVGYLKEKSNFPKCSTNPDGGASSSSSTTVVPGLSGTEHSVSMSEECVCQDSEFIDHLSNKIDEAVNAWVRSGGFPSTVELPKAVVKKVTSKAKRKLEEISEDLLYTSNISFQITAVLRRSCSAVEKTDQIGLPNSIGGETVGISPNILAEKLARFLEQSVDHSGLVIKACNGHLNFYSTPKQNGSSVLLECMPTSKENNGDCKQKCLDDSDEVLPCKRRRLEIRLKRSSFDGEEFALYRRYQIKVHNDDPDKVTESSYRRFLVDTPLVFVPSHGSHKLVPPCGFGSFHQQYVIDGKLVAVGVVDILPKCLSSKYLFWDPDLAFLSLGKYSALQEINWVKEAQAHCPSLQYYYLGYYIHSCNKMRYKAAYHPSELLCPLRYEWVSFEVAKPLLDKRPYVVLSDYKNLRYQQSSSQPLNSSIGRSSSPDIDVDDPAKAFCDGEETDHDFEGSDSDEDNGLDSEADSVLPTDELMAADISNIMIDLNGSRVRYKDLQKIFGPIDKRYLKELEMQLRGYVVAVGQELSNHMAYSLG